MVATKGRKSSNKNPPIFSHEFVIQNHGDIVSCVAMVFVVGLMVQATSPWAYTFIGIHHNVSLEMEENSHHPQGAVAAAAPVMKYTTGWKDGCAVFFYLLITIVMHAVFQEYIFDKISKRLHLSKAKHAKFNESSQLVLFHALSILWGMDIIIREGIAAVAASAAAAGTDSIWRRYHPSPMSFSLKMFFIGQLAYWLHCYPELYFQRAKREEIPARVVRATIGLAFTTAAYALDFQQVGIVLLVLHYIGDALLHGARIIHFASKKEKTTKLAFLVGNSVYALVRVATVCIAAVVFLHGLGQAADGSGDPAIGKFNVPTVRYLAFGAIVAFEAYLAYALIVRETKRARENAGATTAMSKASTTTTTTTTSKQKSRKRIVEGKKSVASEDDDLPEVDQATKKNLRSRGWSGTGTGTTAKAK